MCISPILDAQERPQTSHGKLAAFKYISVFRCSRLVSSVRSPDRPASNCWTEVLQCDRQPVLPIPYTIALRGREVQCCSASSWPSACPCIVFAVHSENVCLPPIHCRRWPLVICYHPCVAYGESSQVASYVTDLQDLRV